jgi:large subunit ribosomal protein L17
MICPPICNKSQVKAKTLSPKAHIRQLIHLFLLKMKIVRKFGRSPAQRRMLMRNLVTALIREDQIKTTLAKAKELRRHAEHMVALAKRGTLHARRQALAIVTDKSVVKKLFEEFPQRFAGRTGGFTRVLRAGLRRGDRAQMAIIEYLSETRNTVSQTAKATSQRASQTKGQTIEMKEPKK